MTRDEILRGVRDVARTHLAIEAELRPDMQLIEDLRLDSLRLLTLAVEIENRFRIRLDPDEEATIASVGDLLDVVERKLLGTGERTGT